MRSNATTARANLQANRRPHTGGDLGKRSAASGRRRDETHQPEDTFKEAEDRGHRKSARLDQPTVAALPPTSPQPALQDARDVVRGVAARFATSATAKALDGKDDACYLASSAKARVCMRISPETLLKVLQDGEFKNQHQTGYSQGGGYFPEARLWLEESVAGRRLASPEGEGLERLHRLLPKYGMVEFPDFAADPSVQEGWELRECEELDSYGEISVFFKDSVKERTTFSPFDSGDLVSQDEASGVEISRELLDLSDDFQSLQQKKVVLSPQQSDRGSFFESQIWGPLKLSDIDYVVCPRRYLFDPTDPAQLEKALTAHGIAAYREKPRDRCSQAELTQESFRVMPRGEKLETP